MDLIIVCHTEFGYVNNKKSIFEKSVLDGVTLGCKNLARVADKYQAKVTFAVMPENARSFPKDIKHEIGLHLHPGWAKFTENNLSYEVGDKYLSEKIRTSSSSTVLSDYPYNEQFELIKTGRDYLQDVFKIEPKVFVAGRWSENNDTIHAVSNAGFTHDCSSPASQISDHFDWSKLPRICMPYHPSFNDYQLKGNSSLLVLPISQFYPRGSVNPEVAPFVDLSWLQACFEEYYNQGLPFFHICLHSPAMIDPYYISVTDELLKFIKKHDKVDFKFASEIKEYENKVSKTRYWPYLKAFYKTVPTRLNVRLKRI